MHKIVPLWLYLQYTLWETLTAFTSQRSISAHVFLSQLEHSPLVTSARRVKPHQRNSTRAIAMLSRQRLMNISPHTQTILARLL